MSWQATSWAVNQKAGGPSAKCVLLCLANYANEDGESWPSQQTIANQTEQSVDTVQRRLNDLEELGLVSRQEREGQNGKAGGKYFYRLNMQTTPQSAVWQESTTPQNAVDHTATSPKPHRTGAAQRLIEPSIEPKGSSRRASRGFQGSFFEPEGRPPRPPDEVEIIDEPPRARLFREGKPLLIALGVSERQSGSVIGRWLKDRDDPEGILAALRFAYDQRAVDPIPYVTQVLKRRQDDGKPRTNADAVARARELARKARELRAAAQGDGGPAH